MQSGNGSVSAAKGLVSFIAKFMRSNIYDTKYMFFEIQSLHRLHSTRFPLLWLIKPIYPFEVYIDLRSATYSDTYLQSGETTCVRNLPRMKMVLLLVGVNYGP
jgi:hypothetical protein